MIASRQLGLGSAGYGFLLGALGLGAVLGAVGLSRLRSRFDENAMLVVAAVGFGATTVVLALVPVFAVVLVTLVGGGAAWLLCLATLNASMQLSLPGWVRARGLSVYLMIFMGGQALGSLLWGLLAGATSSVTSLLVSAALLGVCALSSLWWPLHAKTGNIDLTPSTHWPEPTLVFEPEPLDGPVLVMTEYRVGVEDEDEFVAAMAAMGRSRKRTGAARWRLYRSVEREHTFVETFVVRSWGEHLHQHHRRLTGQDLVIEQTVERWVDGASHHLIAVRKLR